MSMVYGFAAVGCPLALKNAVSSDPQWSPCGPDSACLYYKLVPDETLPSNQGYNHFVVVNGQEPNYEASLFQRVGSKKLDLLRENDVSPVCSNVSQHSMQQICRAISENEAYTFNNATYNSTIANHLDEGMSSYIFIASSLCWGMSRVVHDWVFLWGVREDVTLLLNAFVLLCLAFMSSSGFAWVTSCLELFYAPVGADCGCYFRMGHMQIFGLLVAPVMLLNQFITSGGDLMRALLWGDYLICVKQHISMRHVRAHVNPLSSLVGPTLRSPHSLRGHSEEVDTERSLPRKRTAMLIIWAVTGAMVLVLFPWWQMGQGIVFPRMWQVLVDIRQAISSHWDLPFMAQGHWSNDVTSMGFSGGVMIYWPCLRLFQVVVAIFVLATCPVDMLLYFLLPYCSWFFRTQPVSEGTEELLKAPEVAGKVVGFTVDDAKLTEMLSTLDGLLRNTDLEQLGAKLCDDLLARHELIKDSDLDRLEKRSRSGSEDGIKSNGVRAWKSADVWGGKQIEFVTEIMLRFSSFLSKLPALIVIVRDLYNMPRFEERVLVAFKICPEFMMHYKGYFHRLYPDEEIVGSHASASVLRMAIIPAAPQCA